MKILGIESSGMVASVAIISDDVILAEYTVNHKRTHSETLLPMIDEIVKSSEVKLDELDAIAIAAGPGSFTGLRIGAATAKGLALAIEKPIIPVKTCEGLAFNMWGVDCLICPMMDARRDQVFAGIYTFDPGEPPKATPEFNCIRTVGDMQVVYDQMADSVDEIIDKLNALGKLHPGIRVALLGDGVKAQMERIRTNLEIPYDLAPSSMNRQRAACVGAVAEIYYRNGKLETAAEHRPEYLRVSQAERERAGNF